VESGTKPSSDAKLDIVAPATENVYFSVAEAQEADVNRAVAADVRRFDRGPWPRMSPRERAVYLRAIEQKLKERVNDVAMFGRTKWGSSIRWQPRMRMPFPRHMATTPRLAETFPWSAARRGGAGKLGLLVREPVGVVAPFSLEWPHPADRAQARPALLAGCTGRHQAFGRRRRRRLHHAEIAEAVGLQKGSSNVILRTAQFRSSWSGIPASTNQFYRLERRGKRIASSAASASPATRSKFGGKSAGSYGRLRHRHGCRFHYGSRLCAIRGRSVQR